MDDKERQSVIQSLEDMFVYLGASDVDFSKFEAAYPISQLLVKKDATLGFIDRSPALTGLIEPWRLRAAFMPQDSSEFHAMEIRSVHWSVVSSRMSSLHGTKSTLGVGYACSSSEFDSFSEQRYDKICASGARARTVRLLWGYKGASWYCLNDKHLAKQNDKKWITDGNELLLSMLGMEPTYWVARVAIEPGIPALSLITDPQGIKELWAKRDLLPGRSRRDALLHWVDAHWKKLRTDPDVEGYVRKHLRGKEQCTYSGMNVEVVPSREASVENFISKRERETMADNRPRTDRRFAI